MSRTEPTARRTWIAALVPAVLASAASVLLAPQWRSPLAPLLGPWAGRLFGHSECTMANVAPLWSTVSVLLVVASAGAMYLARARRNWWSVVLTAGASLSWSACALASVLNMTS